MSRISQSTFEELIALDVVEYWTLVVVSSKLIRKWQDASALRLIDVSWH